MGFKGVYEVLRLDPLADRLPGWRDGVGLDGVFGSPDAVPRLRQLATSSPLLAA